MTLEMGARGESFSLRSRRRKAPDIRQLADVFATASASWADDVLRKRRMAFGPIARGKDESTENKETAETCQCARTWVRHSAIHPNGA
jgi:hypothetical protein